MRFFHGNLQSCSPSPFLLELDSKYAEVVPADGGAGWNTGGGYGRQRYGSGGYSGYGGQSRTYGSGSAKTYGNDSGSEYGSGGYSNYGERSKAGRGGGAETYGNDSGSEYGDGGYNGYKGQGKNDARNYGNGQTYGAKGYSGSNIVPPQSVPPRGNFKRVSTIEQAAGAPPPAGTYTVGQKVKHGKFGIGIIADIQGLPDANQKFIIDFPPPVGTKTLLAAFAKLERV
jgi:hypothetical protein